MNKLLFPGAMALMSLAAHAAKAESCVDQVGRMAADHGLSVEAPALPGPSQQGETNQRLAQSGGVVRPPDVGTGGALPPPATGDRMPTNPAPQPGTHGGMTESARKAQAESLLQAATNDARRGDEAGCLAKLSQAQGQLAQLQGGGR